MPSRLFSSQIKRILNKPLQNRGLLTVRLLQKDRPLFRSNRVQSQSVQLTVYLTRPSIVSIILLKEGRIRKPIWQVSNVRAVNDNDKLRLSLA